MCIGRTIFFLSTLAVILILRSSKVESADSNNLDCDFDNGTCSWSTIRTDSTAVWTLMAGRTPSSATGPSSDHTGGGQYIYMEASGTDPNAKAKIQSPLFSTPRSGCMSLWYHMYGKNINQLNVYLQTGSVGTALWSLSGNQGNEWLMANISIQRTYNSRIVIEAVTGDGFLGDIAVDDISFSPNQTCNHVTTQTEPPEYTTEPPDYITKLITRNMYSNSKASNVTSEESTSTASSETTTEQRQTKEQTTLPKSNPTIKTNTSTVVAKGITEDSTIQSFLKKEVTGDYFVTSQIMSTAIKIETSSRQIGQHTTIDMSGYCPSETFEKISWWKTAAGEVDTKPCPPGYKGDATRRCSTDSKWLQPVYIDCIDIMLHETTEKVKELANITDPEKASSAINNILDTVQNTTDKVNQEPLKSGDLVKTTEILENILQISDDKNAPINSQTVGNVLNSVLSPDNNEGWNEVNNEQNTQNKSAANIMGIVEDLGLLIQKELSHDETKTITRSNIEIEVSTLKHDVVFPEEANTESQIRLPDQLGLEGKFYTAVHYKTISNILPRSQNRVIGSDVMSLSFERKEIHLLKNITIKFLRNKKIDLNDPTISCGYWNFSKKSWSYDGCSLKQSDGQHATCVCNHLTNFAILMSPTDVQLSDDHLLALEIITYVGCGLSVLGCILTLLIYCIFWRYVKNEWAVILVNLCIALIIGYSVFMGAAEETGNEIVCNFITALLHYVFLVVFFLMLCEGISVVISVTVVFKTKSKLPIYLSLAWIVPVAIVGATMGITTLKGYHARRYCWLNKDNFVFLAFVGPAILIIIVNVIAIILVLRAMYSSALMANEKIRKKARAGLKCMVTLLPVLGLSWLFGVLTFNEDTIVFQYLFGITTSFQGLFIFIFHVIFNKKVHEGFRKVMHRHRSKAQSNVTSRQKSSGSHVIGSKVNSTDTTNLKDVKTSTPTKKEFRNILGINRSKAYQVTTKT